MERTALLLLTLVFYSGFAQTTADHFVRHFSPAGHVVVVWEASGGIEARVYDGTTWDPLLASPPELLDSADSYHPSAAINDIGDALVTWTHYSPPSSLVINAAYYDYSLGTWTIHPTSISGPLAGDNVASKVTITDTTSDGTATWLKDDGTVQTVIFSAAGPSWAAPADLN